MIVSAGIVTTFAVVNRSVRTSSQLDAMASGIDSDLAAIRLLSRRYTCCSGTCVTTPPVSFGDTKPCAVNNPDSPRYFFPQLDDPTTLQVVEPEVVTTICSAENNTAFLTPLKTSVDAMASVAPNTQRTTVIDANRVLRITYRSTADNRRLRVALVVPPMAHWCT